MTAKPLARAAVGLAVVAALATSGCAAGRYAETAHEKTSLDGQNATLHNMALRGLAIEAPSTNYYLAGSDAQLVVVMVNRGSRDDRLTGITTSAAAGWAAYDQRSVADRVHASANASAGTAATAAPASVAAPSSTAPASSSSASKTGSGSSNTRSSKTGSGSSSTSANSPQSPSATTSSAAALPKGKQSVTIPAGERVSFGVPDATGGLLLTGMKGKIYPGSSVSLTFTFAQAGSIQVSVPVELSDQTEGQTVGP